MSGQSAVIANEVWQQHRQRVEKLNHWQAEGRLAATRGTKGGNASFVWQQQGNNYRIKLFGPFGAGAVYIIGNERQVEVREANGKITSALSAEEILQKIAGWYVPLSGLRFWLRGIPTPHGQVTLEKLNQNGYLSHLLQQGWQIQYQSYAEESAFPLPNKLHLQNGEVTVKMVVKSWKMLPNV